MQKPQISPSEGKPTYESVAEKLKRLSRATLLIGPLLLAACSGGGSGESAPSTTAPTEETSPAPSTTEVPETTPETTTPTSPEVLRQPVGEFQFMGAVEIIRKTNATTGVDDYIAHRLNSAGLLTHPDGSQESTGDPMLDYGFTYDISSGILDSDGNQIAGVGQVPLTLGVPGETTVMSAHNVTDIIDMPVTIDGVTYNHSASMESEYNRSQKEGGTNQFKPNLNVGDIIKTTVNNPDGTATLYTYEVRSISNIDADDAEGMKNIYLPPAEAEESHLNLYWCWPPGSAGQRQVANAVLVRSTQNVDLIPDPGEQPPDWSAVAN